MLCGRQSDARMARRWDKETAGRANSITYIAPLRVRTRAISVVKLDITTPTIKQMTPSHSTCKPPTANVL